MMCGPGQSAATTRQVCLQEAGMFKRLLLTVFAVAVTTACAASPQAVVDTAADEAKIRADGLAWFDHYNMGDADGVANLYADDALLMPPNAPMATGRSAIRAFIAGDTAASKAAGIALKNASVTGVSITGDSAWLSGTYAVTDAGGQTIDTGKYLSVHRRTNGAWLYVRDIWNSDQAPAPPAPPTSAKSGK